MMRDRTLVEWAERGTAGSTAMSGGLVLQAALALTLLGAAAPVPLAAQSLLERPPDLDVAWVAPPGSLQFDFLHRFTAGKAPQRKVINSPTFLLAAGLPRQLMVGFNYATNSDVADQYPNEWELFGRWRPVSEDGGAPLDAAVQGGYNVAARSFDAALAVARRLGPLRLLAEPRLFTHAYYQDRTRAALAGGAVLRLNRWFAVAGDVAKLLGSGGERAAWGAGLQLAIPYTPHTLSLQATNATTGTLEGASRGSGTTRYGFAFTIPVTLARYFGRVAAAPPAGPPTPDSAGAAALATSSPTGGALPRDTASPAPANATVPGTPTPDSATPRSASPQPSAARSVDAGAPPTADRKPVSARPAADRARPREARTVIRNLAFLPVSVAAGGLVTWTNRDAVTHTITADDGTFESGPIAPGSSWSHRFARPGRYAFHCTPHPFMRGKVTVQ